MNVVNENNRTKFVEIAEKLEKEYQLNPNSSKLKTVFAEKLIQLGELAKAQEVLGSTFVSESDPQSIYLLAQIKYLTGSYEQAECLYDRLLDGYPDYRTKAEYGLEYVYYQTNQYQKVQRLSKNSKTNIGDMMRSFGDRNPYKVSWIDNEETVLPFLAIDPLPVVEVEINGMLKKFIIDTGAGETYLKDSVAKDMEIAPIATSSREYAGGAKVQTSYGILESMQLGEVLLESVPVHIADLDHFSTMYNFEVCGVFGTGIFKQFHVTIDYITRELVLKLRDEYESDEVELEVPFIIADTHFMLSRAIINGKETNVFLDSGLGADASLLLPKGTLEHTGINIPVTEALDGEGGLGGADFSVGYFTASTYQMGDLPTVHDIKGMYGVFPEAYYFDENFGIFVDGIISHNYLKKFKWSIDFDRMVMKFHE